MDKGDKYDDKGRLGSYCTSATQFPNPEGMKVFSGYGASDADLERGFCKVAARELPDYDRANYVDRYSLPSEPDEDSDLGMSLPKDYEFRQKELHTKGMFMRQRYPRER